MEETGGKISNTIRFVTPEKRIGAGEWREYTSQSDLVRFRLRTRRRAHGRSLRTRFSSPITLLSRSSLVLFFFTRLLVPLSIFSENFHAQSLSLATTDRIFREDCKTVQVYEARTKDIVAAAVRGFNGNTQQLLESV